MTSRQLLRRLRRQRDTIERDGLVVDIVVARQLGVDGNEVIGAADLDAVAGIIDDGDVGVRGRKHELAHRALELDDADVSPLVDDLEFRFVQQRREFASASLTVLVRDVGMFILAVADDQRFNAFAGRKRRLREQASPQSAERR